MKKIYKYLSFILVCLILVSVSACGKGDKPEKTTSDVTTPEVTTPEATTPEVTTPEATTPSPTTPKVEEIDYVSQLKLDMNSNRVRAKVTTKLHIDGDTTHFYISDDSFEGDVLKARYLAINTPESTGKIEAYGKTASEFTKERVQNATSIIIESDTETWNADSTGDRYMVWVWYRLSENDEYRNLNLEILQNGLAIASNTANNSYGTICVKALEQAKALKLYCHSGKKDPNMYYGDAIELTLKELRTNIELYKDKKVAFEANIYKSYDNTIYLEEFDPETNMYYGITAYLGYGANGDLLSICSVGNRVRMVGSCQYYEAGGTYQIADLKYRAMKPNDPNNVQKIGEGFAGAYPLTTADHFVNGKVTVEKVDGEISIPVVADYAKLAVHTTISMENLQIVDIYTTTNAESSSKGAMTFTCKVDGITVSVRTVVLKDSDGNLLTEEDFEGKVINVRGVVDYYDGQYQIKVFSINDITFNNN